MLQEEKDEKMFKQDFERTEEYRELYIKMCSFVDEKMQFSTSPSKNRRRKFKSPKIEVKLSNGNQGNFHLFGYGSRKYMKTFTL